MKIQLLLAALFTVVLNDPLQTIYNDINIPQGSKIRRVTKLQEITFTHSLTNFKDWLQYPGLTMVIKIPFDQFVPITYNIVLNSPAFCWLVTRLVIDGKDVRQMYAGSDNVMMHNQRGQAQILLTKGDHSIRIDYLTNCNFNTISAFYAVMLRIDYLQVQVQKS